jgi:hypothetical protein
MLNSKSEIYKIFQKQDSNFLKKRCKTKQIFEKKIYSTRVQQKERKKKTENKRNSFVNDRYRGNRLENKKNLRKYLTSKDYITL